MRFRADLPTILDLALVLDLVAGGSRLVVDPAVCFSYRRHEQSASSQGLQTGDRFAEDRDYFAEAARRMHDLGWERAAGPPGGGGSHGCTRWHWPPVRCVGAPPPSCAPWSGTPSHR